MNAALLTMRDVAVVRGGRLLFERIGLTLEPGEALVVGGPNGAGKSSLLRVAAGLLRAAAGTVVRGGPAALADERLALDEQATLATALGLWAQLDGERPEPGIEVMGLADTSRVPVRMLSTGQRKRAAIARVVASGAPLWLLDEPANGLDDEGLERLARAMAEHRARGGAILAASHQPLALHEAASLSLGAT